MRLKIYKMTRSILLELLTLEWDISRTIRCIEVNDGSFFFCILHAFSFELNISFDWSFPLNSHRFKHNFLCSSFSCSCQAGIEDNKHFLLYCPRSTVQHKILLDLVSKTVDDIVRLSSKELCNIITLSSAGVL